MEYKINKKACAVAMAMLMLAAPLSATAYDVGESDALNSLNDGYNYRPPSRWKGSGGYNESGGPMMMDEYLTPTRKKPAPKNEQQIQGDVMPGDKVREGDDH